MQANGPYSLYYIYRDILSMYLHKPTQYMNVLEKFEEKIIKKWKICQFLLKNC